MDMNHLREIGQNSSQNQSSSNKDILVWAFAGVSCLALLVTSGFFAMSFFGDSSVQASAGLKRQSVRATNKRSNNLYANLQKRCKQRLKVSDYGDSKFLAFERHFDKVGQMAGQRSTQQQKYLRCMLSGSSDRFCTPSFKTNVVADIKDYVASGSSGRLLTAAGESFGKSKQKKSFKKMGQHQRKEFRTKDPIVGAVRRLMFSGHLKPGDFSSFWGTPDWVKQLSGGNNQDKNPCA